MCAGFVYVALNANHFSLRCGLKATLLHSLQCLVSLLYFQASASLFAAVPSYGVLWL